MGIQGLLPLLKPIQRRRHLSEFAGQTLAVDAYVWLHRGAYACATELAQGRPTRRYVDFCMARVRLLRHHHIEPYLVFDGGPLPAKLGTEKEREKRREKNMGLAKELLSQGKTGQAAEYYAKCVDVTPQMAYQVIKALKSENVKYIVAPYEADAQLAYLEHIRLVDGIITEDSDLLVFGCKNVHVKLDTVSASVVSICRADFGSPALAAGSFSLIGWSEAQFRWMAMLSGCDYLPSIAGIGLKTAYQLLRKYKAVDKAVKMIRLEGKKSVPKDYINSFYLAEKVFLHQRVYDPLLKKLVYLTDPHNSSCLSEADEMYIGRDIEPPLAMRIACGDVCPISLADMEDINPSFIPKQTKARLLRDHDANRLGTPKGTDREKKGNILNFFAPISKPPSVKAPQPSQLREARRHMIAGNASGKRTLTDVMEHDISTKRKKITSENEAVRHRKHSTSHFFDRSKYDGDDGNTSASEKENVQPSPTQEAPEFDDPVSQEEGYLSPSPSLTRADTPDVSSPSTPRSRLSACASEAQSISSRISRGMLSRKSVERIFVRGSSEPVPDGDDNVVPGPDLAETLEEDEEADRRSEATSEIVCWEDGDTDDLQKGVLVASQSRSEMPFPPGKLGKKEMTRRSGIIRVASFDDPTEELELLEIDEVDTLEKERNAIHTRLATKWRLSYAHGNCRLSPGLGDSKINSGDSQKSKAPRADYKETTPSRSSADPAISCKGRGLSRTTDPLQDLRLHCTRQNLQTFKGDSKRGSRGKPIVIDVNDSSVQVESRSKEKLHAFRFCV